MTIMMTFGTLPKAFAEDKALVVGLHSAALGGMSRRARLKAIDDLAQYLSSKLGRTVSGRNYARIEDLLAQAKAGTVQLAIVSAQVQAEQRLSDPIAVLSRSDAATIQWQILSKSNIRTISELQGKTIAIPRVGRQDQKFVTQVVLEGEVAPQYFQWLPVADAESGITSVNVGQAQATVVPVGVESSLKVLYTSRPIPSAVVTEVATISEQDRTKVAAALMSWSSSWPGYTGWRATQSGPYAALRNQMNSTGISRKLLVVKPKPFLLADRTFFQPYSARAELPSVINLVKAPQWMPDQAP